MNKRIKNVLRMLTATGIAFRVLVPMAAAGQQMLQGHVPAVVSQLTSIANLPAAQHLRLAIGLPWHNQAELSNLLEQIYAPTSPSYHHYLSPKQFTDKFGPTEEEYQAVISFAQAHGLTVKATHPNRAVLDVDAPVSSIEQAFHIKLGVYQHPTEPRTFYAPDREPSLDLAVPLLKIAGLRDCFKIQKSLVSVGI